MVGKSIRHRASASPNKDWWLSQMCFTGQEPPGIVLNTSSSKMAPRFQPGKMLFLCPGVFPTGIPHDLFPSLSGVRLFFHTEVWWAKHLIPKSSWIFRQPIPKVVFFFPIFLGGGEVSLCTLDNTDRFTETSSWRAKDDRDKATGILFFWGGTGTALWKQAPSSAFTRNHRTSCERGTKGTFKGTFTSPASSQSNVLFINVYFSRTGGLVTSSRTAQRHASDFRIFQAVGPKYWDGRSFGKSHVRGVHLISSQWGLFHSVPFSLTIQNGRL